MERKFNKRIARAMLLDGLQNRVKSEGEAHYLIICTCLMFQNEAFQKIGENKAVEEAVNKAISVLCTMDEFFEENKNKYIDNKSETDLSLQARVCIDTVVEDCKVTDESMIEAICEVLECAYVAKVKLWLEKWTREQIIGYVEKGNIPLDLTHSSIMYEWAVSQGYSCTDLRSLRDAVESRKEPTAEEEKANYKKMEILCNIFDLVKDGAKVIDGYEEGFIDNNLKDCRNLFMVACVILALIPNGEGDLDLMWDLYASRFMGEDIKAKGADFLKQYKLVFMYCVTVLQVMKSEHKIDICSHDKLFSDVIKRNAEKHKNDKEKTECK